ncbi:nitrate- and nitrite sensing domain-containing protein [Kitasatospora sp. GP82]|uniref:sensor histidine kinase n=1 Tax=Kitasatospora sp. GP82 TaxID=3035089 RepID=UPI0024750C3E|nr:nitrate- and nitrite sensing domain-containing protein [Kitasatospora sp. GP82]MDH6130551.1 signal transduction histidine kinase [Kitasatospora sp. GP82]
MRRKQPVTPQRRSEPRENEAVGSGQPPTGGFSAFTPAEERTSSGPGTQVLGGPGGPGNPGGAPRDRDKGRKSPTADLPDAKTTEELRLKSSKYDFLAPRNWRVPTRLVAILLIPVVIGLVFGGLRVNTSFDNFTNADHAEKTAELARAATQLADALENERDLSVIPIMTGRDDQGVIPKLRAKTDEALATYNAAFKKVSSDSTLARRNDAFQQLVVNLPHLRDNAFKPELFATATQGAYSTMFAPLLAIDNSVGFGSSAVTSKGRAIYAMSLAKASASTQRSLMLTLLVGIGTQKVTKYENQDLIQTLLVSAKLEQTAINEFSTGSTSDDAKVYADAVVKQADDDTRAPLRMPDQTIPTMQGLLNIGLSYSEAAAAGFSPGETAARNSFESAQKEGLNTGNWMQATSSHMTALRTAETNLLDQVVANAADIKSNAQFDAILNSAIVILALALAGLLTGFIARSMILGMRVLNTAALDIANHRLPDLVEKLSKTDPDRVDTSVSPIPLWGKDEIGEVARAFDEVHQQAVSLAAEQALLRGNVNAIFTNLSRRSQGLIQRQLALITDLENNEADPDQLENLFKLDHLATRMRRNGENLLVLAGEEAGRRWNTPVPLVDVLRAAASEVEQYERVELSGIPEAEVVGAAVTDLVHLLAELLENATTFSSPQTRVLVNATGLPDGRVLVEIHDKGIGLTAEDFAEINEKLAEPPTVDATISRRMGLFVVGRLSQRHDIRVQLRPSGESAGTTSLVMLPPFLTQMRSAPEPEEQFTVSRIFEQEPQDPWAQELPGSPRSAAELGFDDHLTGNSGSSGFSPALEAMQRSQRIDQRRRAALEAGPDGLAEVEEVIEAELEEASPATAADPYGRQPYAEQPYGQDQYQAHQQDAYGQQDQYGRQYADDYGYQQNGRQYAEPGYAEQPYGQDQHQAHQQDAYGQQDQYGRQPYAEDYGQDQYGRTGQFGQNQPYGGRADQPTGHPYTPEPYQAEPAALPPAAPQSGSLGSDTLSSGLPQRRPGQQLAGGTAAGSNRPVGGGFGGPSVFGGGFGDQDGGETPNWFTGAKDTAPAPETRGHEVSALGGYGPTGPTSAAGATWQSPNDSDWQRAEQLREPAAGGTTPSGLPRRVPKQNLVPGNAKATPQDGPQVSRNPEEVRGRLTNLRRGVEQGRSASGDSSTGSFRIDPDRGGSGNGQQNSSTDLFGGSNHQER